MKSRAFRIGVVVLVLLVAVGVIYNIQPGSKANTYEMVQPSAGSSSSGSSTMVVPNQAQINKPVRLSTVVQDNQGKPLANVPVNFSIKADFLGTSGLVNVGSARTNIQGVAVLDYTPHISGDVQLITSYGNTQTAQNITIADTNIPNYQATAGIQLPTVGKEVLVGTPANGDHGGDGAPPIVLRLPGGTLSWLLLFVAVILLIWSTYFRVFYQVLQISVASKIGASRFIPTIAMVGVILLGSFLIFKIITGPFSNPDLVPNVASVVK